MNHSKMVIFTLLALASGAIFGSTIYAPWKPHFHDSELKLLVKVGARLPEEGSCEHPDIVVRYHVSNEGKVFGVRLVDPAQDFLYLEAVLESLSKWRYSPRIEDRLAWAVRNLEYAFSMDRDFCACRETSDNRRPYCK